MLRKALVLVSLLALAGCKADMVEVKISTSDIKAAMSGEAVMVPFEATYAIMSEMDDEQRAKMDQIKALAGEYITIDDFQLTAGDYGSQIEVEGELPLITPNNLGSVKPSALAVFVEMPELPHELEGFLLQVRLGGTDTLQSMISAMQEVDYSSAAEEVNPVRYKIKADAGVAVTLLAGGVQIDGESFPLKSFTLPDGESTTLTFKGGPYEAVNGAFLMTPVN